MPTEATRSVEPRGRVLRAPAWLRRADNWRHCTGTMFKSSFSKFGRTWTRAGRNARGKLVKKRFSTNSGNEMPGWPPGQQEKPAFTKVRLRLTPTLPEGKVAIIRLLTAHGFNSGFHGLVSEFLLLLAQECILYSRTRTKTSGRVRSGHKLITASSTYSYFNRY